MVRVSVSFAVYATAGVAVPENLLGEASSSGYPKLSVSVIKWLFFRSVEFSCGSLPQSVLPNDPGYVLWALFFQVTDPCYFPNNVLGIE